VGAAIPARPRPRRRGMGSWIGHTRGSGSDARRSCRGGLDLLHQTGCCATATTDLLHRPPIERLDLADHGPAAEPVRRPLAAAVADWIAEAGTTERPQRLRREAPHVGDRERQDATTTVEQVGEAPGVARHDRLAALRGREAGIPAGHERRRDRPTHARRQVLVEGLRPALRHLEPQREGDPPRPLPGAGQRSGARVAGLLRIGARGADDPAQPAGQPAPVRQLLTELSRREREEAERAHLHGHLGTRRAYPVDHYAAVGPLNSAVAGFGSGRVAAGGLDDRGRNPCHGRIDVSLGRERCRRLVPTRTGSPSRGGGPAAAGPRAADVDAPGLPARQGIPSRCRPASGVGVPPEPPRRQDPPTGEERGRTVDAHEARLRRPVRRGVEQCVAAPEVGTEVPRRDGQARGAVVTPHPSPPPRSVAGASPREAAWR
jgi:hypothetical protein